MSYFSVAFAIWLSGKVFFKYYESAKWNDRLPALVTVCVLMFGALCAPTACVNSSGGKHEVVKRIPLTVTKRVEMKNHLLLHFSNGYTFTVNQSWSINPRWFLIDVGDKVQKLIYSDGDVEYTPVFDE